MRNAQLIRQWKILNGIAENEFKLSPYGITEMAYVFSVTTKTIRRDLEGLKKAGFLKRYLFQHLVRANHPWEKQKRARIAKEEERQQLRAKLRRLKGETDKEIAADSDFARCNLCRYIFKVLPDGRTSMKDFREHKAVCQ